MASTTGSDKFATDCCFNARTYRRCGFAIELKHIFLTTIQMKNVGCCNDSRLEFIAHVIAERHRC